MYRVGVIIFVLIVLIVFFVGVFVFRRKSPPKKKKRIAFLIGFYSYETHKTLYTAEKIVSSDTVANHPPTG